MLSKFWRRFRPENSGNTGPQRRPSQPPTSDRRCKSMSRRYSTTARDRLPRAVRRRSRTRPPALERLEERVLLSETEVIPYLDTGYKFQLVAFGEGSGFEQPGFDDSGFSAGDAGFGTPSGFCALNNPTDVKTTWPLNSDILLRRQFNLPGGGSNLKVSVAIDNDIQVYVNGHDISGGIRVHEGCPTRDSFVFAAPDEFLTAGANLLAVRARDRGILSYLDVRVTATVYAPPAADAGGPYSVAEGGQVVLTGSGSDPDGDPLEYAWDQDNDGTFETLGQDVTFSAAGLDGPSSRTVRLRVCDNHNACDTDSTTVNITNVPPTLSNVAGLSPIHENDVVHLTGDITDPGTSDSFTLFVGWGDGTIQLPISVPAGATSFDVTHPYLDDDPTGTP